MKTKRKIVIALTGIFVFLFILAYYHGVFVTMHVKEKPAGGYILAGMEIKGPYAKVGTHMQDLVEQLKNYGVSSERSFGIYYDNPEVVKPENCRSFIGAVLEKDELTKIENLKSAGFKLDSIPVKNSIEVVFPIKNSFSYMIGPKKAYPVLSKYIKEKKYTPDLTMEIYNNRTREIIFLMQYH